jgi:hypothetical protein
VVLNGQRNAHFGGVLQKGKNVPPKESGNLKETYVRPSALKILSTVYKESVPARNQKNKRSF